MKVLQINTVYKNGGSTGRIVYELSQQIEKCCYESYVAFGYEYIKTNDENTFKLENILRLKSSILKTRVLGEHGFYNKNETKKLIRYIDKINPDIIHLHNLHNHYLNVEILFNYLKEKDIPIVWTLHDCWSFTGWCAYFEYVGCEKWKNNCYECPNTKEYPYTWFFDRSSKNYKRKKNAFTNMKNMTIVTPSFWLKKLVEESYLRNYPVKVINNGVNLEIFKYTKSDLKKKYGIENKKIILSISMNLSKRKGFNYIMELSKIIDEDYVIVVVGLPTKSNETMPQNIICIGKTNSIDELAKIYSIADVFVNPTMEDNFPTTNLEALACGVPVVTFKTGGSPESINSLCGKIVDKGDTRGLLSAIKEIISNNENISWRDNCRQHAEKLYSNTERYNDYIQLYKTILGEEVND